MVTDPLEPPTTIPDDEPTEAMERSLLLHVPPLVVSAKVIVKPVQTLDGPVMAPGAGKTFTVAVVEQPVDGAV